MHSQTAIYPEQLVHEHVIWHDPRNLAKHTQGREDVPRQEEEKERRDRGHNVVPISRQAVRLRVVLGMWSVEQRARDEILGPDHACGPDEEPPT